MKKKLNHKYDICPECDGNLHYTEGCEICLICGWSACNN